MHVSITEASQLLLNGKVVAVPTETVYGLAASLEHPSAIEQIFILKNRPSNNPLIIHLASVDQLQTFVDQFPPDLDLLIEHFWPGPLTVVLPVNIQKVPAKVRGGLMTAAFRVPDNSLTRELLTVTGPLVMPSANLSGTPSATCAAHVENDFGIHFPVIDGGECLNGVESTIVMSQKGEWRILRLGALSPEAFIPILGYMPSFAPSAKDQAPLCPGQLYRHYAPKAKLILSSHFPSNLPNSVLIGFSDRKYPANYTVIFLGNSTNPQEATHNLYAVLRKIDTEGIAKAYVDINFPETGLWLTLKERITKAAESRHKNKP